MTYLRHSNRELKGLFTRGGGTQVGEVTPLGEEKQ